MRLTDLRYGVFTKVLLFDSVRISTFFIAFGAQFSSIRALLLNWAIVRTSLTFLNPILDSSPRHPILRLRLQRVLVQRLWNLWERGATPFVATVSMRRTLETTDPTCLGKKWPNP